MIAWVPSEAAVEAAARAMYEGDHPGYVASGLTWDHVAARVPQSAETWRRYARAALAAADGENTAAVRRLADQWDSEAAPHGSSRASELRAALKATS